MEQLKNILPIAISLLAITGCGNDIECEPTASFYRQFDNGNRPSNQELMEHMECVDADGNRIKGINE